MFSRLLNVWQNVKNSLWFFPAIICVGYFFATVGVYIFEMQYLDNPKLSSMLYNGTTEDAKMVVSSLFTSMITMATLAISITMVVLSLAASQLGPRIIKSFIGDRKTQTFMGVFIGVVISCFVLVRILHDGALSAHTPALTVSLVFFFCFSNLLVLLAFVHHVAQISIADNIITHINQELLETIEKMDQKQDDLKDPKKDDDEGKGAKLPKTFDRQSVSVQSKKNGYIQYINYEEILDIAKTHSVVVKILYKSGYYAVSGQDLFKVSPKKNMSESIQSAVMGSFIIGNSRSQTQDIGYSIRHLVEIALRALSPGINDNFTAITVLDRLSSSLAELLQKEIPKNVYYDDNEKLRVYGTQHSDGDIIAMAFSQIRQAAEQKMDVTKHLITKIMVIAPFCTRDSAKKELLMQLDYIKGAIEKNFEDTIEAKELMDLQESARKCLK